jgi:hypothetical protein
LVELADGSQDLCRIPRCSYLMAIPWTDVAFGAHAHRFFSAYLEGVLCDPSLPLGVNIDCVASAPGGLTRMCLQPAAALSALAFELNSANIDEVLLHNLKQSLCLRAGNASALLKFSAADQDTFVSCVKKGEKEPAASKFTLLVTSDKAVLPSVAVRFVWTHREKAARQVTFSQHAVHDATETSSIASIVGHFVGAHASGTVKIQGCCFEHPADTTDMNALEVFTAVSHPDGFLYMCWIGCDVVM